MTRWSKVRAVAAFEFLTVVRSKGWLIATFGMPVFLSAYGGLISGVGYFTEKSERSKVTIYGVLDETGLLGLEADVVTNPMDVPPAVIEAVRRAGQESILEGPLAVLQNVVFRPVDSETEARQEVRDGRLKGYLKIPADYIASGVLDRYLSEEPSLGGSTVRQALGNLLRDRLLAGKVADEVAARIRKPVADLREWTVTRDGEVIRGGVFARVAGIVIPLVFAVLLLVSILASAGGLIQATAVEKENKVVEVLLASANPDEVLLGKLLGVGATGLLQMLVWFGMLLVAGLAFAATLAALGLDVPWLAMGAAVAFFAAAYLFYGSLMLGTGSIGSTQREVQQWAMVWSFLAAAPMVALTFLINEPSGLVARILTWIPFSAPIVVVFRMAFAPDGIAWWEIAGPFVLLVACTWLAIRVGARFFRVGILLTGARPKLREIVRQARLG